MLWLWNHTERFDCLRKVNSYKAPYYTTNSKRKVVDDLRKLNYYGNLEDEVVMNNINEDSKFESYGILSRIACGFEERKNSRNVLKVMKESILTHPQLSSSDAFVHTETLFNYLQ